MRYKYLAAICLFCCAVFFLSIGNGSAALVSSFDSGDEGWYIIPTETDSTMSYQNSGGNPGGYVEVTDDAGLLFLHAPSLFLGDLSAYDGETLSFDSRFFDTGGGVHYSRFGEVTLEGGSHTATIDIVPGNLTNTWTTYSTSFTAGGWGMSDTDWAGLLADITDIYVNLESHNLPGEVVGFDNFTITGTGAAPVPEPGTLLLFGTGLLAYARFRKKARS